ncbi:MAG: hypothetical protein IJU36_08115 [Paludibacteraceae bacterium]|nr:hypothetical protein [Paludibacteraceae bacterium]
MKKILTVCAALLAAFSLNATVVNMTCAEAASAAMLLDHNTPGTDTVCITGYVTNTDGNISRGQQVFWMDDQKGSTQTFEGYWCNLPQEEVEAGTPLNVGDKISITGFLMRYNNTPEMKNGDVTIIERAIVVIDTIPATVCEAIEECEALDSGDNTGDIFQVTGIVSSLGQQNDTYHTQSFYMDCEDNEKTLQAYNITMIGDYANVGDTVFCQGRLKKFNETLEIVGDAWVIGKAEVYIPDTIEVTVAEAVEIGLAINKGYYTKDIYVVTGYVDSIVTPYDTNYNNISFFMCDDLENPTYQFEAYRANVDARVPVVGDKVCLTGQLKHYWNATDSVSIIEIEKCGIEFVTETLVSYYIKHPWGTGADADWTWKPLTYTTEEQAWYIFDLWGGVGCNIADNAEGENASWFAAADIVFLPDNKEPAKGTVAQFVYYPADHMIVEMQNTLVVAYEQTALEDVTVEGETAVKRLINGKLFIIRDGVTYDAQGAVVK